MSIVGSCRSPSSSHPRVPTKKGLEDRSWPVLPSTIETHRCCCALLLRIGIADRFFEPDRWCVERCVGIFLARLDIYVAEKKPSGTWCELVLGWIVKVPCCSRVVMFWAINSLVKILNQAVGACVSKNVNLWLSEKWKIHLKPSLKKWGTIWRWLCWLQSNPIDGRDSKFYDIDSPVISIKYLNHYQFFLFRPKPSRSSSLNVSVSVIIIREFWRFSAKIPTGNFHLSWTTCMTKGIWLCGSH